MDTIPYGYCNCGCGHKTNLAVQTVTSRGYIKGEPYPYLSNHHRRSSGVDYLENENGCWVWQLGTDKKGYARKHGVNGKTIWNAHRWYYEQKYGEVPNGADVHHRCEVKACVNPDHLEVLDHCEHSRMHRLRWWSARKV